MSLATDKSEAEEMYAAYVLAEKAVLRGQSYSIGNRVMTKEHLDLIRKGRAEWKARLDNLSTGNPGVTIRRVVPRDT